ncbi:putative Type I site-specific deoxyribonuclease [Vibrio jasicida]|uniref:restriction endonuclease subunit S n=1 Tax=Vibrio jasicida TaxID=766224 RepID=UPI002894DC18|nr:putative Type I site-specific deoxyribonuclease [Vibrio jasicida]
MSEIEKLPNGWVLTTIPSLISSGVFTDGDWVESKDQNPQGSVRLLQLADIGDGFFINKSSRYLNEETADYLNCTYLKPDDVLVARMPDPLGRACLMPRTKQASVTVVDVCVIRPAKIEHFSTPWLMHFINAPAFREKIASLQSGSTRKRISRGNLSKIEFPLPPRNEQDRIVNKLEELFSELDAGVKELKAAQTKLSQYCQSLLKSAVEGSLTQQWRAENSDRVQETGEQLLARILKQRREQWQQQKLAEFAGKGKTPSKNWQDKYPEPVQPDATDLPELPEGWVWASLSQIGWLDRGKSKHRPRNAEHLYGGVYPFVQTGEIRSAEQYIRHTEKTYSEEGLKQSKLWPKGTMCITIAANIGETAILDIDACFPDSIVGFSKIVDDMPIEYVEYVFRVLKHKLDDEAPATAQKNINLEILYKEVIPLPPVIEQLAIVEYLDTELDNIKLQKTATALGLKQSEAQRKNILKSAFSGQLVPQDPNDEPASVLLEKIKQEREALAKLPKSRKPRKTKIKGDLMNTLLEVLTAEKDWIDAQDAFQKCGIVDGTSTDRIEEIYTELRKLEKAGKIQIQRQGGFDQLKLIKQEVKEG